MRSNPSVEGSSESGGGLTAAIGTPTTTPTIMIQASTTLEPSIRLEREEHRVAIAHSRAAPRPPMMAVTVGSVQGAAGLRGLPREDGAWAGVRTAAGRARRLAAGAAARRLATGPPLSSGRRKTVWYHPPSRAGLARAVCRPPSISSRTVRFSHLGQDAPHLDRRPVAVRSQARPSGAEPPRGPPAPSHRREDLRREGPDRCRAAPRI